MGMTEIILQDFTLAPFHLSDTKIGKRNDICKLSVLNNVKRYVKGNVLKLYKINISVQYVTETIL